VWGLRWRDGKIAIRQRGLSLDDLTVRGVEVSAEPVVTDGLVSLPFTQERSSTGVSTGA